MKENPLQYRVRGTPVPTTRTRGTNYPESTLDLSDGTRISYRDHGRGKALQDGVDEDRFSDWLESTHGLEVLPWEVADYRDSLLDDFFTQGGFDVDEWTAH